MAVCKTCGQPMKAHSMWSWNIHKEMFKASKVAEAMRKAGLLCTRRAQS